jgi:uncharacterized protein YdhG (YjbR/CyaY superfamily)
MTGRADVDAYLAKLPPETRATLERVRKAIQAAAPTATEAINYGVPMFRQDGKNLVGYGPAKHHCSIYGMDPALQAAFADELAGYDLPRGTIRFPIGKPPAATLVRRLVKARLARSKELAEARAARKKSSARPRPTGPRNPRKPRNR